MICSFPLAAFAAKDSTEIEGSASLLASKPLKENWTQAERKWFYRSVMAHGAGSAADAWSTWHQSEANSLLRGNSGRFDTKGLMIKAGFFAGATAAEYAILRKYSPKWLVRTSTITNYALGAEYSAIAISNRVRINRQAAR